MSSPTARRASAVVASLALGAGLAVAYGAGRWSASEPSPAPPATTPPVTVTVPLTSVPLDSPLGRAAGSQPPGPGGLQVLGRVSIDDVEFRLSERDVVPRRFQVWPGWTPPASCQPTREVVVQASAATWVTQLVIARDGAKSFGGATASVWYVGEEQGDPTWLVAAAVPPGVADASVSFRDGTVQRALLADRVALVARHGAQAEPAVLTLGGDVVHLDDLFDRADPPQCRPPTVPMPPAVDVAPADRAVIGAAVTDLVESVLGGRRGFQALAGRTDDPQLFEVLDLQLARARALPGLRLAVDGWVFTGPDRIVVRYDVFGIDGERTWWSRFAVLVHDGDTWKFTRDSVCEFVLLASAGCPGWTMESGPTAAAVAGTL